jgi:hypothetical protein
MRPVKASNRFLIQIAGQYRFGDGKDKMAAPKGTLVYLQTALFERSLNMNIESRSSTASLPISPFVVTDSRITSPSLTMGSD